eukprot:4953515-Amphidinium_carterae.1
MASSWFPPGNLHQPRVPRATLLDASSPGSPSSPAMLSFRMLPDLEGCFQMQNWKRRAARSIYVENLTPSLGATLEATPTCGLLRPRPPHRHC